MLLTAKVPAFLLPDDHYNFFFMFCHMKIGIPKNRADEALFKLKEIRGIEMA
ncbi:MAG: hypothetical protein KF746_11910 [Chitinophagaceae bacterium]|nr:hypothetical protein [Chitinophagaceae bacterium]